MSETTFMRRLMVRLTKSPAVRVFRNHVAVGYTGQLVTTLPNGDAVLRNWRRATFGLCPGSSDLVGWTTVEITPDMVGRAVSIFTAIEVKSEKGRATDKQNKFIEVVEKSGGIAFVARSEDGAIDELRRKVCRLSSRKPENGGNFLCGDGARGAPLVQGAAQSDLEKVCS